MPKPWHLLVSAVRGNHVGEESDYLDDIYRIGVAVRIYNSRAFLQFTLWGLNFSRQLSTCSTRLCAWTAPLWDYRQENQSECGARCGPFSLATALAGLDA